MKKIKPQIGRLLISDPDMTDLNFERSVLIITEHNEHETIGFVINQATKIKINDLFEDFPEFNSEVSIGGPVQKNSLHFIHTLGEQIEGSLPISENLYLSGDFDTLKKLIKNKEIQAEQIRFFIGYSGWSAGQLEMEIEEESWIVVPENEKIVLEKSTKKTWRNLIRKMDEDYAIWSNLIQDPTLN